MVGYPPSFPPYHDWNTSFRDQLQLTFATLLLAPPLSLSRVSVYAASPETRNPTERPLLNVYFVMPDTVWSRFGFHCARVFLFTFPPLSLFWPLVEVPHLIFYSAEIFVPRRRIPFFSGSRPNQLSKPWVHHSSLRVTPFPFPLVQNHRYTRMYTLSSETVPGDWSVQTIDCSPILSVHLVFRQGQFRRCLFRHPLSGPIGTSESKIALMADRLSLNRLHLFFLTLVDVDGKLSAFIASAVRHPKKETHDNL